MPTVDSIWRDIEAIRRISPVVYNITDSSVMNNTANALLALGATPIMAQGKEEAVEMAHHAASLVVNIRTANPFLIEAMSLAMKSAKDFGKPIVFDPVRAGTTTARTELAQMLIAEAPPDIIRGNETEIPAILSDESRNKLIATGSVPIDPVRAGEALALQTGSVVVVSGPIDYITNGRSQLQVKNGSPMMVRVTGMGCTATAICGAFMAVNPDPMEAAFNAMATMGVTGEITGSIAKGPGLFQAEFLDALFRIDKATIAEVLRW